MENKNFNVCRVVLTNGTVLVNYCTGTVYGLACAGTLANGNCAIPCADGLENFQETAKKWAYGLQDREDVEYIEFI